MIRTTAFAPLALLLVACAPLPDDTDAPFTASCEAGSYAGLVGLNIAAVTLPADLEQRVIGPGMAYTQDFRPDRLNIEIDRAGVIQRVWCG